MYVLITRYPRYTSGIEQIYQTDILRCENIEILKNQIKVFQKTHNQGEYYLAKIIKEGIIKEE